MNEKSVQSLAEEIAISTKKPSSLNNGRMNHYDGSSDKFETIGECIDRHINLFRCGYIEQLARSCALIPRHKDKTVQDAADKDT